MDQCRIPRGTGFLNHDFEEIFDAIPVAVFIKDRDSRIVLINRACEAQWGVPREAICGTDGAQFFPPEQTQAFIEKDKEVFRNGAQIEFEEEFWNSTLQENRIGHTVKKPIYDAAGEPAYLVGITSDITERKLAESARRQIEESMKLAAQIYRSSSEAIMVTDEHNRIVDVNDAFTRLMGYELSEIEGKDPKIMQSGLHDKEFYRQFWQAITEHGRWQGEVWDRRSDGQLIAKWVTISVIRNPDGSVFRHVAQFSDITEKKQQDELIWHQANFDPLTDLPNRRLFRDRLEQEVKKAHRTGKPLALLFIDLDHFKEINDTFGHDKGDLLLAEAARRIRLCVRDTDTLARLGGDEFTVIIPEFQGVVAVERIAQQIIAELSTPFEFGSDHGEISASVGITVYPDDAESLEELMKLADRAMYLAKDQGRGRFAYFTESMQRQAEEKRVLTSDLRHALTRDELIVYFQPIVDATTARIVKAEALLRWRHPVRGIVSPMDFIPLAEESGLILEIGEWVFQRAIDAVAHWQEAFGRLIPVSVNKSPLQFAEQSAGNRWMERLRTLSLPSHSITVEITESILIKDSPTVKRRLLDFRNRGVEVSIDDFGTGFSSLSYLKQFDVDFLKIDRSFIGNLAEDAADKALTEAIIVMAHKLGLKTIAEGVETEAQRDMLVRFACDYAQGYLFSEPLPIEGFDALLQAQTA
ncbi:MAG TPA: EAL domain-containing protein [Aromatoleum sp.]|uniref:sensor domain-containing protein n=1 Tax=Aromatoleum sp. TaxID=2307007 RepID=UPI002B47CA2D|nr:EAL domain-containing protein [Aromatoleum sp.]HJV25606.1 EAL domain-containing protein [Aromatoleum sp.]